MPIAVTCPECSAKMKAPDAAAGKKVKCPKCGEMLTVPAAQAEFEVVEDEPAPPKKVKAEVEEEEDEKPKKKAKAIAEDDEDEDEKPKKKRAQAEADEDEDAKPKKKAKAVTEDELRKAMGIKESPREHDDVLTWALAPLSSRDIEVAAVGPAPSDGYTLRCRVTRDAVVSEVVLVVDARTGRKRTASIQMAGMRAKLADKLENVLSYGEDGAPSRFRSSFRFKMAWIERSAEVSSERVVAPAPRAGVTAPR